ncbi:hypothetical protein [Treponema succinifaciens]|uniref:Uncharacterized protein n=1 Tax=Treponema succinifaciens (strain ATCC 33096 / DSM 2489 / 6091) TaxID=869209 RepID=F2NTE8_TRES6|nr:hypothetical protein [Treponema succinifaciens]AEB14871.1 hypothetical protein Tresu_1997 [Treponema succinifaciens DSM 2489]
MSSEDFKREFNISAKIIYRKWLMDAIEKNEYESFKDCVLNLGIEWHVIRTVKKVKREDFYKNLWDNRKNIQNGTYNWWTGAPSYKSKVCFLINPQYYKLIYDSKNRDAINEENCKPANWQDVVDKYYEKDKKEFLKSEKDVLKIFEIDYYLWNKGKQLRQNKS